VSGWRGAALVAVTYIYFLIFAQFGFVARLEDLGLAGVHLNQVMAAMAVGGILLSLLTPRLVTRVRAEVLLRAGLLIAGVAALLALAPLGVSGAMAVAFFIGAGLGITTVTLVSHLPEWAGQRNPILTIGIGTGTAYFFCNIPAVFTATGSQQAMLSAVLCLLGVLIATPVDTASSPSLEPAALRLPFAVMSLGALVWLDSAAFYIIQHAPVLKAGTWMGEAHLWANGCIHLCAAIASALLLGSRRVLPVLAGAVLALGFACTLLLHPTLVLSASLFYPVGVSLYSVALVAYPSFLSGAQTLEERARAAGWIYAIAGWIGSALGIGMGQHLGQVPPVFVLGASAVVLAPVLVAIVRVRLREVVLLGLAMAAAFGLERLLPVDPSVRAASAVESGRQVYVSEGCMSCHSQYVRPGTADEVMWGPTQTMQEVHAQKPPLIGNRRQGPDLAEVGLRRTPLWLKTHLIDPAALSGRSAMPSYALLFEDGRGEDLVAYLASLNAHSTQQLQLRAAWQPSAQAWRAASADEGAALYEQECRTCHDANGAARRRWGAEFQRMPPDAEALRGAARQLERARLARVIRFGAPTTEMPGHEYLSDRQVASLSLWLTQPAAQPVPHP
jgi:cytochrome c oxidase cbb3-type subunit 2